MKRQFLCFWAAAFLLITLTPARASQEESAPPLFYRSIAFQGMYSDQHLHYCRPQVLREIARVGFNDICFHTEWGEEEEKLRRIHDYLEREGMLELADELDLTISAWVHEFMDLDPAWGEPALDNAGLWKGLERRYDHYFTRVFPELDYLILTTTETDVSAADDVEVYGRLVQFMARKCREHGVRLIVRNFAHGPAGFRNWERRLATIPEDVIIQTKHVGGDFNLRAHPHPLLGTHDPHREVVEYDVGGEYFRGDHLINCYVDYLKESLDHALEKGVDGISVRINRFGSHAFGHPNASNYYYLGLRMSGRTHSIEVALRRFATDYYNAEVADTVAAVIRPTGEVTAEALSLGHQTFGVTRDTEVHGWTTGLARPMDRLPYQPWVWSGHIPGVEGTPMLDEYKALMRGGPEMIRMEREAYEEQLASINRCIDVAETLEGRMDQTAYDYLHYLLESTRYHLIIMQEAQLAWLKAMRHNHVDDPEAKKGLARELRQHCKRIRQVFEANKDPETRTIRVEWHDWSNTAIRTKYPEVPHLLEKLPELLGQPPEEER